MVIGSKWTIFSGDLTLTVHVDTGPIGACIAFLNWCLDSGNLGRCGMYLDLSESGRLEDVCFRRVLGPFAARKLGWNETLLNYFLLVEGGYFHA